MYIYILIPDSIKCHQPAEIIINNLKFKFYDTSELSADNLFNLNYFQYPDI